MNEYAKALVEWLEQNRGWHWSVRDENTDDIAAALSAVPKPVEEGSIEVQIAVTAHEQSKYARSCAVVWDHEDGQRVMEELAKTGDTHRAIIRASIPPVCAVPVVEGQTPGN